MRAIRFLFQRWFGYIKWWHGIGVQNYLRLLSNYEMKKWNQARYPPFLYCVPHAGFYGNIAAHYHWTKWSGLDTAIRTAYLYWIMREGYGTRMISFTNDYFVGGPRQRMQYVGRTSRYSSLNRIICTWDEWPEAIYSLRNIRRFWSKWLFATGNRMKPKAHTGTAWPPWVEILIENGM